MLLNGNPQYSRHWVGGGAGWGTNGNGFKGEAELYQDIFQLSRLFIESLRRASFFDHLLVALNDFMKTDASLLSNFASRIVITSRVQLVPHPCTVDSPPYDHLRRCKHSPLASLIFHVHQIAKSLAVILQTHNWIMDTFMNIIIVLSVR